MRRFSSPPPPPPLLSPLLSTSLFPSILTAQPQVLNGEPVNLSTRSSIRPVLTQLPAPAAPPVQPSFGLQLPGRPPVSLQPGGVSLGGRREDVRLREQHEEGVSRSSGAQTQGQSLVQKRATTSSASATTAFSQSPSAPAHHSAFSSLLAATRLPGPGPPVSLPVKLVPIFRNRSLTRHINVTQLLAQKQQNQRMGGPEEGGRVTLANYANQRAVPAPSSSQPLPLDLCLASFSSSSSSSLRSSLFVWAQRPPNPVVPPPLSVPSFTHRSKSREVNALRRSRDCPPEANHTTAAVPNNPPNPTMNPSASQRGDIKSGCETPPPTLKPPAPVVQFDVPSNKGVSRVEQLFLQLIGCAVAVVQNDYFY